MEYTEIDTVTTASLASYDSTITRRSTNRKRKTVYSTYVPNHRFSRYNNTFHTLFTLGRDSDTEKTVDNSGIFSFITFHWVFHYLSWKETEWRLPESSNADACIVNSARLDGILAQESVKRGQKGLSMVFVVWKFIRTRMIFACILYVSASVLSMLGIVLFLPKILCADEKTHEVSWLHMFALIVTELLSSFLFSSSHAINLRTAIRLRAACFASLYRQTMLSSITYKISSWQLISFLLADGQDVQDFVLTLPNLISSPIILICCTLFAGLHLGLAGYLSVAFLLLFFPLFIIIALLSKNLLHKASLFSDERVKLLEEFILNNICAKLLKYEDEFERNVTEKRKRELQHVKRAGLYDSLCFSFIQLQPIMSMTLLFIAYDINPFKSIARLSEFSTICIVLMIHLKQSLELFWYGLNSFIKGLAALHKYKKIMIYETISVKGKEKYNSDKQIFISINNANFQWEKQKSLDPNTKVMFSQRKDASLLTKRNFDNDTLRNICMEIEENQLIGICGHPGSGKSSLLLGIMGLLLTTKGKRKTNGTFAYCGEDPLILNVSLKNNILFGSDIDNQRYYHTINQCDLKVDSLKLNGIDDVINPNWLSLQEKQLIALARAIYSNADIYLLDNPLSSLEPNKRIEIFQNAIVKNVREREKKIVLIVTDNVKFLEQCDQVYMLDRGEIILKDHHLNLVLDPVYTEYIECVSKQNNYAKDKSILFDTSTDCQMDYERNRLYSSNQTIFSTDTIDNASNNDFTVMFAENKEKNLSVLLSYCSHFGNFFSVIILVLAQIINAAFISFLPIFFIISLEHLSENMLFLEIYYGSLFLMLFTGVLLNWYFNKKMFSASLRFHNEFMKKIYRASLLFFQVNSLRIISTLAVHLQLTDLNIPRFIYNILLNLFIIIMTIGILIFVSPWFVINIAIVLIVMILAVILVRRTSVNTTVYEITYFDLIYTQISTMLKARPVIQAYDKINDFSKQLYTHYDDYMINIYMANAAKGWLIFVLQTSSVFLLTTISIMTLLINLWCPLLSDFSETEMETKLNLPCVTLAILCTLQLCSGLQKFLLLYINAGSSIDMLTEIQSFKDQIEQEDSVEDNKHLEKNTPLSIHFKSVCVNELENFSFRMLTNEKMGIVGLKSVERQEIIAILFKLIRLSTGYVEIGGKDITDLMIDNLRDSICVIPAEPFLFNTTIRKMFAPLIQESELPIFLNNFLIWDRILRLPQTIDTVIDNLLTYEEKQILCLAEACIKQSPIIIIEDVIYGSSIEYILAKYLQKFFPESTMIIFANDRNGLKRCDHIITVQDGKIIEDKTKTIKKSLAIAAVDSSIETSF